MGKDSRAELGPREHVSYVTPELEAKIKGHDDREKAELQAWVEAEVAKIEASSLRPRQKRSAINKLRWRGRT